VSDDLCERHRAFGSLRGSPTITTHGIRGTRHSEYEISEDGVAPTKTASDKPPYRVPTMKEIRELPWNGYTVASTFSGGGGSSCGYKMAGFRVAYASEFVEAARDTYSANFPDTYLDDRDIRTVKPADILKVLKLQVGELDLFDGSPPCASFSTAGKREKGWGTVKAYSDTKQRTDDLFFEYTRLLRGLRPKTFVAENVSGLVKGTAKGYFKEILKELEACGYNVVARVLDAQWLGVPQSRSRLIFVGVRDDLKLEPAHPKPFTYRYSVRDAIPWIRRAVHDTSGAFSVGEFTDRPSPAITIGVNSLNSRHYQVEPESSIEGFAIDAEAQKLGQGQQSERYFNLVRPREDEPSPCVTAMGGQQGAAAVIHPVERRKFSIAELRRICSFPDDFVLTGTYEQQWERCGRAVPPLMMREIASTVQREILDRLPKAKAPKRTRK